MSTLKKQNYPISKDLKFTLFFSAPKGTVYRTALSKKLKSNSLG